MAIPRKDPNQLLGKVTGLLKIVAVLPPKNPVDNVRFFAYCECGGDAILTLHDARNGRKETCGCAGAGKIKKGKSDRVVVRNIWYTMMTRCYDPDSSAYANYGGRGISVAKKWHDFEKFYTDIGERPSKFFTLERINNDGNYCPSNVKWATRREQATNKRNTLLFSAFGKSMTIQEWSREYSVDANTIRNRMRRGAALENSLHPPGSTKRPYAVRSTRASKLVYTFQGKTQSLKRWAEDLNVSYRTLWCRVKRGSPVEDILSSESLPGGMPLNKDRKNKFFRLSQQGHCD